MPGVCRIKTALNPSHPYRKKSFIDALDAISFINLKLSFFMIPMPVCYILIDGCRVGVEGTGVRCGRPFNFKTKKEKGK